MTPWFPTREKGKSGKGKGKPSALDSRKPKFAGTCSHCGIVGHMARDCYKRQQETTTTVKQNTVSFTDDSSPSPNLTQKPELIQFQQFPTFVKRKLEGSSTNEDSDEDKSDDDHLTPEQESMLANLGKATDKWEAAIAMQPEAAQSWGQRNNPNQDEANSDWGDTHSGHPTHSQLLSRPQPSPFGNLSVLRHTNWLQTNEWSTHLPFVSSSPTRRRETQQRTTTIRR